ncbi:MAG: hypothetical protein NTV97_03475 [Alphaproteobacteria bacterium]|nr:hypothetical protein [Alphaproteobacteria bacterium]
MGIRREHMCVLAKIESSYGTDPTPTGGANAVLLRNVDIDIAQGDRIPRDILRAGMGHVAMFLVGRRVTMTCTVDLAGAGAAGTAPPWGPIIRSCAVAEAITADTKVDYTSIDTSFESSTIYFNLEGTRTKMVGVRGSAKLQLAKGKLPAIVFQLTGLWVSDTAVAFPSLTLTGWIDPVPVTKVNTPTFTLDSQAVVASSFELDLGVSVAYRELINLKEIAVQDRLPTMSTTFEELPIGTKNFFAMMGGASIALDIVHGITAGNIVEITSSTLQVIDVKRSEDQKIAMLNLSGNLRIGSPDYTISVK